MSEFVNSEIKLKFDGLYRTDIFLPDNYGEIPYFSYLKFYKNGEVIGASSTSDSSEKVSEWLKLGEGGSKNLSVGKYKIKENKISFTLEYENGRVDYEGIIQDNRIIFDTFSHITNFSENNKIYYFIQ